MSATDSLTDYLDAAREAALRAAVVLEEWRPRFQVREKGRFDLVTDADLASQRTIAEYLAGRFPAHAFLGEEDGRRQRRPVPTRRRRGSWTPSTAPPTTSTTARSTASPSACRWPANWWSASCYDPSRQEMFAAAKGVGAWLNDRRLHVSRADGLEEALLATGFPPDLRGQERTLDWWRYFSLRTHSLRRTGSTALNLAYVAAGRFDGYFAFDNHVWDVAGGVGAGARGRRRHHQRRRQRVRPVHARRPGQQRAAAPGAAGVLSDGALARIMHAGGIGDRDRSARISLS